MGVSADFYVFSEFLSASSLLCFAVLHSGVRQTVEGRSGHVQEAFSGLSHRPLLLQTSSRLEEYRQEPKALES